MSGEHMRCVLAGHLPEAIVSFFPARRRRGDTESAPEYYPLACQTAGSSWDQKP